MAGKDMRDLTVDGDEGAEVVIGSEGVRVAVEVRVASGAVIDVLAGEIAGVCARNGAGEGVGVGTTL